ncbi:MAG: ATP-binding protein [Planctomycetia bacterium]|nr:ATP-binding protein [Planctomycetia bacterium]
MAVFYIYRENHPREQVVLTRREMTIGRDPNCEICIPDTEISRNHAKIRHGSPDHADEYMIFDLDSLNGTFVNDQQVSEYTLQAGDRIQVGGTILEFSLAEPTEPPLPAPRPTFGAEPPARTAPTGYMAASPTVPLPPVAAPFPLDDTDDSASESPLDVTMATSDDQAKILRTISHTEGQKFLARKPSKPVAPEASWTLRAQGYLQLLYEMTLSVSHCMDIDRLSNELLELIFQWIDADRGCILLFNKVTNRLEPKAKKVRENLDQQQQRMIISKTILDYVLEHREGVLTSDATQDDRWNDAASVLSVGIHEAICVPLQGRYGIVGAIYLDTFSRPDLTDRGRKAHRFGDDHLKLMITMAHHAAIAIEDTRYYGGMLQAERLAAIGQTVATLSHHIKNILQGIQGGSFLIQDGLTHHNETFISKGWQIVERNQNRISSLVLDMLTFSKDRKPELTRDNLNRMTAEVVELMQARANDANVQLTWQPDANVPDTLFDPEAMHHAILNLVTNAIDAVIEERTNEGEETCEIPETSKTVRFPESESVFADGSHIFDEDTEHFANSASASGILAPCGRVDVLTLWDAVRKNVKILVKDTGPGLTKEQVAYIFKPFESSKGNRGTGLGLPVCKKIIREHGGTIHVEQRTPHGCRFIITLPAIQE